MAVSRTKLIRLCVAAWLLAMGVGAAQALDPQVQEFKIGSLTIVSPWARATPKGATTGAAYLTILNSGDVADRLTGVTAEIAGRSTPHEMAMNGEVMTMRDLSGVAIPAHGKVVFKPGAPHVMLEHLTRPLKSGESFSGSLTFEKSGTIAVSFVTLPIGARGPSGTAQDGPTTNGKTPN